MRWMLGALAVLMPLPALALSCMPFGVTDAYLEADTSADAYVPVLGTLAFDPAAVPQVDWDKQSEVPQHTDIPSVFEGNALTQRGIDIPMRVDVTLEVGCAGPWCPSPKPGPVLAFLRKTEDAGYAVSIGACDGFLFGQPAPEQIGAVKDCLAGLSCRPTRRR